MDATQKPGQIVFTNKARCRDCYRCLRACPVKAIRIAGGQAYVDADRCIACGTCIRECPQEAKSFRNDVDLAAQLIKAGGKVAATVAPSFVAHFTEDEARRLPDALRALGFTYVAETAIGAYAVAKATAEHVKREPGKPHVCSACPAVVSYVERYEPDFAPMLVPVLSPFFAHAKEIKEKLGEGTTVVFIGPCVAKKAEAERADRAGIVDCVLTFTELEEWFTQAGVNLAKCGKGSFDDEPEGEARFFPVPGGLARTASLHTDILSADCLAVSGFSELKHSLEDIAASKEPLLLEPLFCPQGCVNGPGMHPHANLFAQRKRLIGYASTHKGRDPEEARDYAALNARFDEEGPEPDEFTEEQILEVLRSTGKANKEDQLNCGACGYDGCRENAIAVLRGMAAPDMCIPHMRRLAEQRSDRIIETTPNGIVIVDEHFEVLHMNKAFRAMFCASDSVLGKPISYLIDPEPFVRVASEDCTMVDTMARHDKYNLVCHQLVYPLRDEKQYVGVFVNLTDSLATREKLTQLRSETLRKARQLMEHQIQAAQEMARYLGESTARSEELVRNIQSMASDKPKEGGDNWIWDTDT